MIYYQSSVRMSDHNDDKEDIFFQDKTATNSSHRKMAK